MTDPISRIVAQFPEDFFRSLLEHMDAAFAKAHSLTSQNYAEPERLNMLGQARHALCEDGFRMAARNAGLSAIAPHTKPAGSRYSLVKQENIFLIRGNVQTHCGPPRPTRFRKTWAALNRFLDPLQLDLLQGVEVPSPRRLCGMIVVTADRRCNDPSVPAFVGLGIPRADLSEWVVLEPVQSLLARYNDTGSKIVSPLEPQVEVRDQAIPRLRKRRDGSSVE